MVKHVVAWIALLSLLIVASPSALAAEPPGKGVIEGQLVDGTGGGGSVAEQTVTLDTLLNDASSGTITTKSDSQGYFKFEQLDTDPGYSYRVKTTFQEAEYSSDLVKFDKDEPVKQVSLTVYDAILTDEAITTAMSHTVIYIEGNARVSEFYLVYNGGDRTYIGSREVDTEGNRETLRFSLPKGASELELTSGLTSDHIRNTEDGFCDTMPVYPGEKEVIFSYTISLNGGGAFKYSNKLNYPTARYDFLFEGENIDVITSDQLTEAEPLDIRGTLYNHYSAMNLAPGSLLTAELSPPSVAGDTKPVLWAGAFMALLVAGSAIILVMKRRRPQPIPAADPLEQKKHDLLVELAQLDDELEAGNIPGEVHNKLRAEKKAELVRLLQENKRDRL